MTFIMGNHDYWFANGIPNPRPPLMSEEEKTHQEWTHKQIGESKRTIAQKWKFVESLRLNKGRKLTFMHYGIDINTSWFKDHVPVPNQEDVESLFEGIDSDIIFYGHNHLPSDIAGNSRYVNLGSAGCYNKPEVRVGILEIYDSDLILGKVVEEYNDKGLMEDFELRKVPAREFITKHFITRE